MGSVRAQVCDPDFTDPIVNTSGTLLGYGSSTDISKGGWHVSNH